MFGLNAIAIYIASGELAMLCGRVRVNAETSLGQWFFQSVCAPLGNPYIASLAFALCHVGVMFLIAYGLYRRGWFLKL